jgi:lipoprotein NlpI
MRHSQQVGRCMASSLHTAAQWLLAISIGLTATGALSAGKVPATRGATTPPTSKAPATEPLSDKSWQTSPIPAWVVNPEQVPTKHANAARRDELVDIQANYAGPAPQFFTRVRTVAKDVSVVAAISQWQIFFNPRYQKAVVHTAAVVRDGVRQDRLKTAQMELMRREKSLDMAQIDGIETLLIVLQDIRAGDAVDLSYSVIGSNPILENHIDVNLPLAGETPIDSLHIRVLAPADRKLQIQSIAGNFAPERTVSGNVQEILLIRSNVDALLSENQVPAWVKVYPTLSISDYRDWKEVEDWSSRLFALPATPDPEVAAMISGFQQKGLQGEELLSEVLRFVQDEIRYFSVSLGESSHRPKSAARTLKERFGDCKDKVVLLNTLLTGLGIDARPALVSTYRNRGLTQFPASVSQLDHVISRVKLGQQTLFVDPTLTSQGTSTATRGQISYGVAIIPGSDGVLQVMPEPPVDLNTLAFEQRWDLTSPGVPPRLTVIARAHGLLAESYRTSIASRGIAPIADFLTGPFTRMYPGMKAAGDPTFQDARATNTLQIELPFIVNDVGEYKNGSMNYEFAALELLDLLVGPAEPRRRFPFFLTTPTRVESKVTLYTAKALPLRTSGPTEVSDKSFRLSTKMQTQDKQTSITRVYQRSAQEVLPQDLEAYRQAILRARGSLFSRFRDNLMDTDKLRAQFDTFANSTRKRVGSNEDNLYELVFRAEMDVALDSNAMKILPPQSPLINQARISRATAFNHLGEFAAALQDADAALSGPSPTDAARDARGVALVGLGRLDDAMDEFLRIKGSDTKAQASHWVGSLLAHLGRYPEAEQHLREALANSDSEGREFVLLWLYLAAEGANKQGKETIAPHVSGTDPGKLAGALLHYFSGQLDKNAVYKIAEGDSGMRRLNLAEVHFFLGMQSIVQGNPDLGKRMLRDVLNTKALPYREYTFAGLKLR